MDQFEFAKHMSSTGGKDIFGSHKKKKTKGSDTRVRSIRKRRKKPPKPIQVPCELNIEPQPTSQRPMVETPGNKRRRSRNFKQNRKRQSSGSDEFDFLGSKNGTNHRVPLASKKSFNDGDEDEHDNNEIEELEIPYALDFGENANSSDDSDGGYCSPSSGKKKKRIEPLRPGDLVEYTCPIFVAGSRNGRRTAIVLSTDPSHKKYPIVLNNGELLSRDVHIRRIGEFLGGDLHQHDGVFRSIDMFLMARRKLPGHDFGIGAGLKHRAKNLARISKKMEEDAWKAVKNATASPTTTRTTSTRNDKMDDSEKLTKKAMASSSRSMVLSSSSSDSSPILQCVRSTKRDSAATINTSKDDKKIRISISTSNRSSSNSDDDSEDCLIPRPVEHNTKVHDNPKSARRKTITKRRVILSSSINSDSETSSSGRDSDTSSSDSHSDSDSDLLKFNSIQRQPSKKQGDLRRDTTGVLSKTKQKPATSKSMSGTSVLGLRKENSLGSSKASSEEQETAAVTRPSTSTSVLGLRKQRNTVPFTVASTKGKILPAETQPSPATSVLGIRKHNGRSKGFRDASPFMTTDRNVTSANRSKKKSPRRMQGTGFQPLQLSLVAHSTPVSAKRKNKKAGSHSKSKKRMTDTLTVNLVDS